MYYTAIRSLATWYVISRSLVKLTEIETSYGRGLTVTQKPINTNVKVYVYNYALWVALNMDNREEKG